MTAAQPASLATMSATERRALLAQLLSGRTDQPQSYPLSFAQQRLWFLDRLNPGNPAYNIPGAFDLEGAVDVAALTEALNDIVKRHATLRTVFSESDGRPVQTVLPTLRLSLPVIDPDGEGLDERIDEARRLVDAEAATAFDLREAVIRARLIRLTPQRHILVVVLHHICADGWSLLVFNRDLATAYAARRVGDTASFTPLATDYARFSAAQRKELAGARLEHLLGFWKSTLEGLPALDLPLDRPRPALAQLRGEAIDLSLDGTLVAAARELARQESTTLYCVLLAAFRGVLARLSGQSDFAIATPVAGRTHTAIEDLIGFFVNTLPIRLDLTAARDFRDLARRTGEGMTLAQAHQELPFEKLVEELNLPRDTSRNPLVQVLFALQNAPMQPLQLDGLSTRAFPYRLPAARFDLELHLWDGRRSWTGARDVEAGLTGTLFYNSELFDRGTMTSLIAMLNAWLRSALASPDLPLSELPLLDATSHAAIIQAGDGGEAPTVDLVDMLATARSRFAQQSALRDGNGADLSYGELFDRADRLGEALHQRGLAAGQVVALMLPRGRDLVSAMLACVRSGFTFTPIDPELPPLRAAQQIALAGAAVVLRPRSSDAGGDGPPSETVEALIDGMMLRPSCVNRPATRHDAPLYIVFTSGSTGQPKGVRMPVRAFANLIATQLGRRPEPLRTLQASAVGFDVAIQEVFFTLATGGVLISAAEADRRDPKLLAELIARERIERAFLPFALLALLARAVAASGSVLATLREIITAGEQPQLTDEVRAMFVGHPGLRLINQYGPAETHVVSEEVLEGDASDWPMLPKAGRPLAGNRLYVLDRKGRPQPFGVAGELHVGGAQIADGYLGADAPAEDRFVSDPFTETAGARMYGTGDLVKMDRDGRLSFLGRVDRQVKIRGYRVEPGEIEVVVSAHPLVTDCIVMTETDQAGAVRLAAYVVTGATPPTVTTLRDWLRPRLPDYMMPACFARIDALPLSANGKVDRAALVAAGRPLAAEAARQRPPQGETEQAIAKAWQEVLGRDDIDCDRTFFDLGGNSLLLVEVHERLGRVLAVPPTIADLFQFPTIAALARHVGAVQAKSVGLRAAPGIRDRAQRMRGEVLR